jgi:hypothetical protein
MTRKLISLAMVLSFVLTSCTSYNRQYVPFQPAETYPNNQVAGGVSVGATAFANVDTAKDAFGFDIIDTGLIPVQLAMDNKSGGAIRIVTDQTFLVDRSGRYWQVVPNTAATERVDKATQSGAIAKGAGSGALWGAAGGAILGAAIGIVSGDNVGSAMGKGAVLGAAGGAVIGGAKEAGSSDRPRTIADDIRDKGLEGKVIPAGNIASGFVFFPAEAKTAQSLKLQVREVDSGKTYSLTLDLGLRQ